MRVLSFILCFTLGAQAMADSGWYHGSVVLRNRDVLVGEIHYTPAYNAIFLRSDNQVRVLNSNQLQAFYFYDEHDRINRHFISVDQSKQSAPARIVEVVVSGSLSVVRTVRFPLRNVARGTGDYDYYILAHQDLVELFRFRSKIFPVLRENSSLRAYVRQHRLNPNQDADALRIIVYYNSLPKQEQTVALN